MKGLFNIFIGKKRLFLFTERLSELISSGCPLQKSLYIISRLNSRDLKINQTASFLHKAILSGTKFSVAISLAPFIKVPEWYASFILASEECGSLPGILDYLKKMLGHEKMAGEKFFSALAYPLLVIILASAAGFFSVFFFIPAFQGFLGGEAEGIKSNAVKTMLYGDIFLMLVFFCLHFL
jgi:type II secretory pathway component PulF